MELLRDLTEALRRLKAVESGSITEEHREAAAAVALAIVGSVKDGTRGQVEGTTYRVEEITWPVSKEADGSSAFACPRPVVSLVRSDAVLLDVRSEYWDGWATYAVVATKVGRWRRFRMGSPGDEGYDLHLATDEELAAFASEATLVVRAFGMLGAEASTPAE